MVRLQNLQVIGGEDKADRRHIKRAEEELHSKHKGANAALYGSLGYLVLIATAGEACQVFAMGVAKGAALVPLVPEFEVRRSEVVHASALPALGSSPTAWHACILLACRQGRLLGNPMIVLSGCQALLVQMVTPHGRQHLLRLFINLTRWVRTIAVLKLLPPAAPCATAGALRPAVTLPGWVQQLQQGIMLPLLGRACAQCHEDVAKGQALVSCVLADPLPGSAGVNVDVVLTLHNDYVKKVALVPTEHLQQLLDVYTMLRALMLPNCILCTRFQVIQPLLVNFEVCAGQESLLVNFSAEWELGPWGMKPADL